MKKHIKSVSHWLLLLFFTLLVFVFTVWLLRPDAVEHIALFLLLFFILLVSLGVFIDIYKRKKLSAAIESFAENPNEASKSALLSRVDSSFAPAIETLYNYLSEQEREIRDLKLGLSNYREFTEAWAHEIKTPLSLMTLLLENRRDEMSRHVLSRLEYVKIQISENIGKILYYARLDVGHPDFTLTRISLDSVIADVLSEYATLAEERGVRISTDYASVKVVSDEKTLLFIISQLVSNAVKYSSELPNAAISIETELFEDGSVSLIIRDSGKGVLAGDLPFIFDKGFTGNRTNRNEATGMGLYLASKYASSLGLSLVPLDGTPQYPGFGISLRFPAVK